MSARRRLAALAVLGLAAAARPALAQQQQLLEGRAETLGPLYERWSFGDGLPTHASDLNSPRVKSASQVTLPLTVAVPLGERWAFDLYGAYASGVVKLDRADTTVGSDEYKLNGLTDLKLRVVGDLVQDRLLLTLGVNAPTGTTKLDREQFRAVQVLGAPALRFASPTLGSGLGATAGLVAARQAGRWALALGTSYEVRGKYAPLEALVVGADDPELDPGDAVHLSFGADGLIGPHRSTLSLASDFYTRDKLSLDIGAGNQHSDFTLGPTYSATWQLQVATTRLRALAITLADRYRSKYKDAGGDRVSGSSGNEFAGGIAAVVPAGAAGVSLGLDGRHFSGLSMDDTPATAAARVFGASAGLVFPGRLAALRPWVRAQVGTLESADRRTSGNGLAAGLTLQATF